LILRQHEQPDAIVLDAAVRSWPPIEPRCFRFAFPTFMPAEDLDPLDLKPERPRRKKQREATVTPSATQPDRRSLAILAIKADLWWKSRNQTSQTLDVPGTLPIMSSHRIGSAISC
jgi:hypothetical protein